MLLWAFCRSVIFFWQIKQVVKLNSNLWKDHSQLKLAVRIEKFRTKADQLINFFLINMTNRHPLDTVKDLPREESLHPFCKRLPLSNLLKYFYR